MSSDAQGTRHCVSKLNSARYQSGGTAPYILNLGINGSECSAPFAYLFITKKYTMDKLKDCLKPGDN
jgi:hypothetical protein